MASSLMNVTVDTFTTLTVAPAIIGLGNLVLQNGTLVLTGANTYSGGTRISMGTLELGNGSETGSIVGAVVNNDTFNIFNANTAGITTITNNFGTTNFFNASTAGKAAIINNGGFTAFFNASTAGNASITNNAGGETEFFNASTAAHSTITNNSGGATVFEDTSTAGNATITTNSGGLTLFFDASTGGNARFITNAGGIFDVSNLTPGRMTAGSIEGAGTYQLGSKALTVGLNNLSTVVIGTIVDGGFNGGSGGSLIKVGTGTLTLTGLNTYTGGTSFNGGIVAVDSDANLGSGGLSFNGGTLQCSRR